MSPARSPTSGETPPPPRRAPSVVSLWLGGAVLLWGLYALVFASAGGDDLAHGAAHALANVAPLMLLAAGVRGLLKGEVMQRSTPVQAAWHALLAICFAFLWYAALVVTLAILRGLQGQGFAIQGFSGPALTWQVFQGLILYAAIAAVCYAVRGAREAAQVTLVAGPQWPPLQSVAHQSMAPQSIAPQSIAPMTRYLIRQGEALTPVEFSQIIALTGAQDYAEVATTQGVHLVRLSLAELEARLDPDSFVRIHRSTIINLAHLKHTEPAGGGRLLAHLSNGQVAQVSRSGAQALRRFVV